MKDLKKELQEQALKLMKALYPLIVLVTIFTALTLIVTSVTIPVIFSVIFKAWQSMPK